MNLQEFPVGKRKMNNRTRSAIEDGFPKFVNVEPPPAQKASMGRPNFDVRGRGDALVFGPVTSQRPTKKSSVEDGDTVTLKIEGEPVIVAHTLCLGADQYRGIIDCFETRAESSFQGYAVGDAVEFHLGQVFGAQPASR